MTIEGTDFSCYTLEAKDVEGRSPKKPSLTYALPRGVYDIKAIGTAFSPSTLKIRAKGYREPLVTKQESVRVIPGNIYIGTKFLTEHLLDGYEEAEEALRRLIARHWSDFKCRDAKLVIVNDDEMVDVREGEYEEDNEQDIINFVGL